MISFLPRFSFWKKYLHLFVVYYALYSISVFLLAESLLLISATMFNNCFNNYELWMPDFKTSGIHHWWSIHTVLWVLPVFSSFSIYVLSLHFTNKSSRKHVSLTFSGSLCRTLKPIRDTFLAITLKVLAKVFGGLSSLWRR